MKKIKVLLVEDHEVVRQGLQALIFAAPDMEVAGEAGSGQAAVRLAAKTRPDVVLMDVALPGMNGMEATREIHARLPNTKVLVLSSYTDEELVDILVMAGAAGYMTKHEASSDLLDAIRRVDRGEPYFSPACIKRKLKDARNQNLGIPRRKTGLSPREKEVLIMIAQGLGNKQMAGQLSLSVKTIEKHRQQVMIKLDIHDVASLTRYAVERKMVTVDNQVAA